MRQILVATDFSARAAQALDRALRLAVQTGAPLNVIHVADEDADEGALHARLLGDAHRAAERLAPGRIEIRSIVSRGDPEGTILDRAEKAGADLIVLGGHGEPRFRDAVFGTTGTHIVRHSAVPALIVQTDPGLPYAKLLVAADSAEAARRLAENALAIAAPTAEVFTIHAFRPSFIDQLGGEEVLDDLAAREVGVLQAALARVAEAHPGALIGAHRHIIADPGDATTVLRDETERLVPDLVVMGTRHRNTWLGSRAADAFFWCPADLLIVPEPAPVPAEA